ncbi:MAG: hypothetical protein ABIJ34_06315 [archaeon]
MKISRISEAKLAELSDPAIDGFSEKELAKLFSTYTCLSDYDLLHQSPHGVRIYLDRCAATYFHELEKEDIPENLLGLVHRANTIDRLEEILNNFRCNLPNQMYRWKGSLYSQVNFPDMIILFKTINDLLYPGRGYSSNEEMLFPNKEYQGEKSKDFELLIRCTEICGIPYWEHNERIKTSQEYGRSILDMTRAWRRELEDTYRFSANYMQYLVQEINLFMVLMKKGFDMGKLAA